MSTHKVKLRVGPAAQAHFATPINFADVGVDELDQLRSSEITTLQLLEIADEMIAESKARTDPSSFWLSMMMPADKSADIIANMEELYEESWLPKYGVRKANWIWRLQSVQFIAWRWAWPITFVLGALKALRPG